MLFINLDPGNKIGSSEKQSLLEQSFDVIYPAVSKFDGKNFYCFVTNVSTSLFN